MAQMFGDFFFYHFLNQSVNSAQFFLLEVRFLQSYLGLEIRKFKE